VRPVFPRLVLILQILECPLGASAGKLALEAEKSPKRETWAGIIAPGCQAQFTVTLV
jgi:hypothetical protein